jgi:hypothetical protein
MFEKQFLETARKIKKTKNIQNISNNVFGNSTKHEEQI